MIRSVRVEAIAPPAPRRVRRAVTPVVIERARVAALRSLDRTA
jgi:hypothetical protein